MKFTTTSDEQPCRHHGSSETPCPQETRLVSLTHIFKLTDIDPSPACAPGCPLPTPRTCRSSLPYTRVSQMLCKGSREAGRQAPAGRTFPRPRDRAARASSQPPGGSEPGTSWEGPRHSLEDPLEDLLTEGSGEALAQTHLESSAGNAQDHTDQRLRCRGHPSPHLAGLRKPVLPQTARASPAPPHEADFLEGVDSLS